MRRVAFPEGACCIASWADDRVHRIFGDSARSMRGGAADVAAKEARARALDPLLSRDDVKVARREMEDANFTRDRLHEAGTKLAERVEALKALEADRRAGDEHERVLTERDRLADEMERMAEPIMQIAHLVSQIEACDREIGRLNATAALRHGRISLVLAGATPAITLLFQDVLVWDTFGAVARQSR